MRSCKAIPHSLKFSGKFNLLLILAMIGHITLLPLLLRPIAKWSDAPERVPYGHIINILACLISSMYGLPYVTDDNFPYSIQNFTNFMLEGYLLLKLYRRFKNKRSIAWTLLALCPVCSFLLIGFSLMIIYLPHDQCRNILAWLSGVFVCLYALCPIIDSVILKRESENSNQTALSILEREMPIKIGVFGIISCAAWVAYGIIRCDKYTWIPNLIGLVGWITPLSLNGYYRLQGQATASDNGDGMNTEIPLNTQGNNDQNLNQNTEEEENTERPSNTQENTNQILDRNTEEENPHPMVNFERNTEDETHQSNTENPQNSPTNTNPDPMVCIQTRLEIENPLNSPGNANLNLERNTEGETDQPNTTNPPSPPQQTTTTQQTTPGVEHVINVHGEGSAPETEGPGDEKSSKGAAEDGKEEDQKEVASSRADNPLTEK